MSNMLIVYYSWSNGNTEHIAHQLQQATGADIARIETVTPYSGSYDDVVAQGQREVQQGYQPPILPLDLKIADYDIIAVGTPTWWYTMAPAVRTFLSSIDWSGKMMIPFQTHGGWPGHTIKDIKFVCKGAQFAHEMKVQFNSGGGDHLETSEDEIKSWIHAVRQSMQ